MSAGTPVHSALVIERLEPLTGFDDAPSAARLLVELDPAASCQRCARGEGCGAGLLASRSRPVQLVVNDHLGAMAGQRVLIEGGSDSHWLWVVAGAYGLPTLGLLLGAVMPGLLNVEAEWVAALVAALGLCAGLVLWQRLIEPRLLAGRRSCSLALDASRVPSPGFGVIETAHTVSIESAEVS